MLPTSKRPSTMSIEKGSMQSNDLRYSNSIFESIAKWASEQQRIITYAQTTSGGWEGWAQVELAFNLTRAYGFKYDEGSIIDLSRESHVFTIKAERVDLDIWGPGHTLVELKCERGPPRKSDPKNPGHYILDTAPSKSSAQTSADDLKADKKKISEKLNAESSYKSAFVIGIAVTPEADRMMKSEDRGFTKYQSNYDTGSITIWYWGNN
ncbi:hypothetical protein DER45DRAFT_557136 [Fusarium avenaceum]|nr:hypothetical protein DER45DRAFT_557136 [Fusarium avenaceum]